MAVDTPARIAILGAGPVGLEAGLYARFLGYDVGIYERGQVAQNVLSWGHVRMLSPFSAVRSTLGLAALRVQDPAYLAPDEQDRLTGHIWAERYLIPLSQSDLLADHLRTQTVVTAVTRLGFLKHELPGDETRGETPFRVLLQDRDRRQWDELADIVIDATGVFGNPNWMGQGGGPAIGETRLREQLEYGIPDVLGSDRVRYAGFRVLVVGSGDSAATTVLALVALAKLEPATRVTWITRGPRNHESGPPWLASPSESPVENARLVAAAQNCWHEASDLLRHWQGTEIESLTHDCQQDRWTVRLIGEHRGDHEFDRVIANVGYRPDERFLSELQLSRCFASDGLPRRMSTQLGDLPAGSLGAAADDDFPLVHPEPNFYVLGAKSFGRDTSFRVAMGLQQIRQLFAIIGDRKDLDLYAGVGHLLC